MSTPAESVLPSVTIPPLPAEMVKGTAAASSLLDSANAITVDSVGSDAEAKALLIEVKKMGDRIEAWRKRWTKPLLDQKRLIDDDFKTLAEPIKEAERVLRAKVGDYARQVAEANRKALERAAEEAQAAREKDPGALAVVDVGATKLGPVKTEAGGVTMREVWTFEVTDPLEVPRGYLQVDEAAIREAVNAGVRNISGVRIFADQRAVVR